MIELPTPDSIQKVADWIELTLSIEKTSISKATLSTVLQAAMGDEPQEVYISSIWRELGRRQKLYNTPSFVVEDFSVEPIEIEIGKPQYQACLIWSIFGARDRPTKEGKLFEKLTKEAVERYIYGRAIILGFPFIQYEHLENDPDETKLSKMVRSLASIIGEKYNEAPSSYFKDRGVDVIAWHPFDSGRSSQVVLLIQCGAGLNWKEKKAVPMKAWEQYIHWACDPIAAFAVPCIVEEREWHDKARELGLIFDRIRIMNLLGNGISDQAFHAELEQWVQEQVDAHIQ